MSPPLMTIKDVAARLYKTERWLKDFLRQYPIGRKAGRTWLFFEEEIEDLRKSMERQGTDLADDTERAEPYARVYVIGFGHCVKIGTSSTEKGRRINDIQNGLPEKLTVYAYLEGGRELEAALHYRFRMYRKRGEWFSKRGGLAKWIASGCPTARVKTRDGVRYSTKARLN